MILTVTNQKGGVGKTTTAAALNSGLMQRGFHTLLIDLDPQSNLTYSMNTANADLTTFEILAGTTTAKAAIVHTNQGDIIPASAGLTNIDAVLTRTGKEYRLSESIEPIKDNYDYIIIDTPPALSILTINALTACNAGVIIPAQADIYSLQGIGQLIQSIDTIKKYCNPNLFIKGILLTRYNARTVISKEIRAMIEETAAALSTKVFTAKIRECTAIKEAAACQQSIFTYSRHSNAAHDYNEFIDELLNDKKEG